MIELFLILLLPVALYLGWWLARSLERRSSRRSRQLLSNQYFQGLNYLLNEQPDKAIEVFLELADVNQDTVETHMALGNLFRRRGEVDRAIRFHQNIIAKPGLEPEQRTQALLELGEDYMKAGLLDRAERLFAELIEGDAHTPGALHSLLDIYQQERDWEKALEQAQRLEFEGQNLLMPAADLAPGESLSYDCETGPLYADLVNLATVSALAGTELVSAEASASLNSV